MYGDEGNDEIWGVYGNLSEYLWGGEGNDYVYGGPSLLGNSFIFGNGGHDVLFAGAYGDDSGGTNDFPDSTIYGGKGDDLINPLKVDPNDATMVVPDSRKDLPLS